MARVVIPYRPHDKQKLLHNHTSRYKTVVCGRRFGKTVYAVNEIIKKAMTKPLPYWYVAPYQNQAKLIAWEIFKRYAVPEIVDGKPNEQELAIHFISGGSVRLIGADKPDRLRGVGLGGAVLDEYADMKPYVWEVVRPMLSDYKGWCTFIGTPKGKQNVLYENWIKDPEYHDKDYLDIEGNPVAMNRDYKSFRFITADNPYIDSQEIEDARRSMAPQYFRQEYEASFETYTGLIYKELQDRHAVEIVVKPFWAFYVGIDTGRHTCVSFVAIDETGKAYVFDEVYDFDSVVSDIAERVKMKLALYRIKPIFIIDSASQVKREWEKCLNVALFDSEKDVENSIAIVRNRLQTDKLCFDRNNSKMHLIQHKSYQWSKVLVGVNSRPQPLKENDHSCNSLQYVLNWPAIRKTVTTPEQKAFKQSLKYAIIQKTKKSNDIMRFG